MVKKKQHSEPHEEHADETWLIPYSDLLTLLLALFIVLFASSSLDKAKVSQMEYVFAAAFNTLSADQMSGSVLNFLEDVKDLKLGDNVGLGSDPNGAVLDIAGLFLFDDGSAVIKPDGIVALRKIAALLNSNKYKRYRIVVEGHTDNRDFHNDVYPSNWELSSARAGAVVRELISMGIEEVRLKAVGMADVSPKYPNMDAYGEIIPQNQKLNNRLEIKIEM